MENLQPRRASFDKKSHHKKENETKPRRPKQARSYKEEQVTFTSAVSDKIKSKEQESKIQRSNNKQAASTILSFVKNSVWNGFCNE